MKPGDTVYIVAAAVSARTRSGGSTRQNEVWQVTLLESESSDVHTLRHLDGVHRGSFLWYGEIYPTREAAERAEFLAKLASR